MIIGFAGKAASGKTTAARCMAGLLPGGATIMPMARVLRNEVEAFLRATGGDSYVPLLYGCQDDKVRVFHVDTARALAACPHWPHFTRAHADIQDRPGQTALTVRRILQWWGTEYRRAEDPDYWTKAWAAMIERLDLNRLHILIDDVRFMNELDTVRSAGGLIIKIERPGFNGAGNHASETALDDYRDWHQVIVNAGSLDDFKRTIAALTEQLLAATAGCA